MTYIFDVFRWWFRKDDNVIKVDKGALLLNSGEYYVHEALESVRGFSKSKQYMDQSKKSMMQGELRFVSIFLVDFDLSVSWNRL